MDTFLRQLRVRVARSREELEKAFALVYREYLRKGYTDANPSGLRYSLYNALPEAATFIALSASDEVVATATIVPDSFLGLPIDCIFQEELNRLRKSGASLCEVTMLAVNTDFFKQAPRGLNMGRRMFMFHFFKVLLDYSHVFKKHDYMCIAVNPRHSRLFNELLFRNLGPVKLYPDVNYAPAVSKFVNMHFVKKGFNKPGKERLYDVFVRQASQEESFLDRARLSSRDLHYFFVEESNIFKAAPQHYLEFIQRCYPSG